VWVLIGVCVASSSWAHAQSRQPQQFDSAEALLSALEDAGREIRTLSAGVRYVRRMALQGDEQTRQGALYFEQSPAGEGQPPRRRFAVVFDTLYVSGRRQPDRQAWVFDGRWLVERRPDEKQYVARELAPAGEQIDPLRLGEGPLPIPIGQRAADVLARFRAELVNPHNGLEDEPGSVHELVADTWQLRLTPRESFAQESGFEEVRLWYDRETLLPRLAKTIDTDGDEAFVVLVGTRVNGPIVDGVFDIEPPAAGAGWDVQIEEFRGR